MASERAAMRSYVTAADHLQYSQLADGTVQVTVTHSNLNQRVLELRLSLHSRIRDVKAKLQTHNGTPPEHQSLLLQTSDGAPVAAMDDDERMLGFYGATNGCVIHVIDTDPFSLSRDGGLDDVSKIAKYRMTDEDYDKRANTIRAYKKKMQATDPTFRLLPEARAAAERLEAYKKPQSVEGITVGARASVVPGDRRGVVAYVGEVPSMREGFWVGVKLDEPCGTGTGARGGVTYFDAADKYAVFVRPDRVAVGEFPPHEDGIGAPGDREAMGDGEEEEAAVAAAFHECECGHSHAAEEKKEEVAVAALAPAPASAPAAKAAPAPAAPRAVGGMRRVGGRRADDSDDDNDDEL